MFRPPAEAYSLILRVADGCPWNGCRFCGMYKGVRYRECDESEWLPELETEIAYNPRARRVFLADGDVMHLPTEKLVHILEILNEKLPRLSRVNTYANGASILAKSDDELKQLRALKLNTLYMGFESGSDEVLKAANKRESAAEMVEAAVRAQACGFKMSIMVLIGLGGRKNSALHARETATILNRMQPRLLSALRVVPTPNTSLGKDLAAGEFDELTEHEAVAEIRELVAGLVLKGTVFRANHVSNIVPLEGRFPTDKERLLEQLDALLSSGRLSKTSSGPKPMSL